MMYWFRSNIPQYTLALDQKLSTNIAWCAMLVTVITLCLHWSSFPNYSRTLKYMQGAIQYRYWFWNAMSELTPASQVQSPNWTSEVMLDWYDRPNSDPKDIKIPFYYYISNNNWTCKEVYYFKWTLDMPGMFEQYIAMGQEAVCKMMFSRM